jgi:hypothetical protein
MRVSGWTTVSKRAPVQPPGGDPFDAGHAPRVEIDVRITITVVTRTQRQVVHFVFFSKVDKAVGDA